MVCAHSPFFHPIPYISHPKSKILNRLGFHLAGTGLSSPNDVRGPALVKYSDLFQPRVASFLLTLGYYYCMPSACSQNSRSLNILNSQLLQPPSPDTGHRSPGIQPFSAFSLQILDFQKASNFPTSDILQSSNF